MKNQNVIRKFFSVPDAMLRYSLSRNTLIKLSKEADALVHVGRKVLIDVEKLDAYLDAQAERGEE